MCLENSLPPQKHEGQMSTPSPGSQIGSAHLILTEWVRSRRQLSHSIWRPGSVTAVVDCGIQWRGKRGEERRDTLNFLGWLWLSLSVSDGHWMSPEKEVGNDRKPDRRFSSHAQSRPPERMGRSRIFHPEVEDEKIKNFILEK